MSRYKRVFRPWFAWNPAKIEDFLEEFASEGWIVERAGFSMMWFRFTKDEPKMVRYCVDYQWKAEAEYKQILEDDGWQLGRGPSQGEPVEPGHVDVQEDDVRGQGGNLLPRLVTVTRLARQLDPIDAGQHADESPPGNGLVVDDQDSHPPPAGRMISTT